MMTLSEIDAAEARAKAAEGKPVAHIADFSEQALTDVPRLAATARTAIEQRDEAIEYARHKRECPRGMYRWNDETQQHDIPSGGCTCGLDAFLAVAQKGGAIGNTRVCDHCGEIGCDRLDPECLKGGA